MEDKSKATGNTPLNIRFGTQILSDIDTWLEELNKKRLRPMTRVDLVRSTMAWAAKNKPALEPSLQEEWETTTDVNVMFEAIDGPWGSPQHQLCIGLLCAFAREPFSRMAKRDPDAEPFLNGLLEFWAKALTSTIDEAQKLAGPLHQMAQDYLKGRDYLHADFWRVRDEDRAMFALTHGFSAHPESLTDMGIMFMVISWAIVFMENSMPSEQDLALWQSDPHTEPMFRRETARMAQIIRERVPLCPLNYPIAKKTMASLRGK